MLWERWLQHVFILCQETDTLRGEESTNFDSLGGKSKLKSVSVEDFVGWKPAAVHAKQINLHLRSHHRTMLYLERRSLASPRYVFSEPLRILRRRMKRREGLSGLYHDHRSNSIDQQQWPFEPKPM